MLVVGNREQLDGCRINLGIGESGLGKMTLLRSLFQAAKEEDWKPVELNEPRPSSTESPLTFVNYCLGNMCCAVRFSFPCRSI